MKTTALRKAATILAALMTATGLMSAADFSREVKLKQHTPQTATMRAAATAAEKKEAVPQAVKSAVDTWLFVGFAEVNDGRPLLEESARTEHAAYFDRLYGQNRYNAFMKGEPVEVVKPRKTADGRWETVVEVEIYTASLERDLRQNGVLSGGPKPASKQVMPSIMVVPYKPEGANYKDILDKDFDMRMAIAKVQDEFTTRGVKTVDFEARLKAALRADDFEYDNATDSESALIKNSGADVYVSVDVNKSTGSYGAPKVSLTLRGYDTATGTVLASKTSSLDGRSSTPFDRLCMLAVQKISRDFLRELSTNLAGEKGGSINICLRIGVDENAMISLDETMDGEDLSIADMVRAWVGKHAVEGRFHQQGQSPTSLIFDSVQIPATNLEGETQTPSDFARRLVKYLKRKDMECSSRIDGNTVYITITD